LILQRLDQPERIFPGHQPIDVWRSEQGQCQSSSG
jgi:hypothetical protein